MRAKVLDVNDPYIREYAKFLEELESGHAITMPAVEFRKTFVSETMLSNKVRAIYMFHHAARRSATRGIY